MSAVTDVEEIAPQKPGKMPLFIGIFLAICGGAAGFYVVNSGLLFNASPDSHTGELTTADGHDAGHTDTLTTAHHLGGDGHENNFAFVPLDPLIISLPSSSRRSHLKFAAQLEVVPEREEMVSGLKPRIIDVLNTYLRAVEIADFEDPSSLNRLRSQMLRRIQIVVGDGAVRDLLIMEFVVN